MIEVFPPGNRGRGDLGVSVSAHTVPGQSQIEVAILTGGQDKPYVMGLVPSLASRGMRLDVIGSDELESPELNALPTVRFLNLRGDQGRARLGAKMLRISRYYARLLGYAWGAHAGIFHILWNNKFEWLDRTALMLYYKIRGKRVVLTAHNVNTRKRDGSDTLFNRLTLRFQYRLCDHIFVHTDKAKAELKADFSVNEARVTVVPFGINSSVPNTALSREEARRRLGVGESDKVVLFFGRIAAYKGLEFLVSAFQSVAANDPKYRLIIAGRPKPGSDDYTESILKMIDGGPARDRIDRRFEFIRDEETEIYFKGADVIVLPYRDICQTGVLFLAYNFGLPVIATDVGAFREDIIEGETGFLCRPCDSDDLANTLEQYFANDLYRELERRRSDIREYASGRHSWESVGETTCKTYSGLLAWQGNR